MIRRARTHKAPDARPVSAAMPEHGKRAVDDRPHPSQRSPRDAAALVVIDWSPAVPRVLMGRRRPDQVFLPDTFVFPGGRVESADRALARHHTLAAREAECLKLAVRGKPSDRRAAALALAAVRETFEETGILIGRTRSVTAKVSEVRARASGGEWLGGTAEGYEPHLDALTVLARAITPPGRPRRYDTRFFAVNAAEIALRKDTIDGELLDIGWFTVEQAHSLKLPSITRHILDDLAVILDRPNGEPAIGGVPFYVHRRGRLERSILPRAGPSASCDQH